jgi:hypothetical protein
VNKKPTNPFLRGMGGKDDFIAEQFVPSELYKSRQMEMVQRLIASGLDPEEVAGMFSFPFDLFSSEKETEQ